MPDPTPPTAELLAALHARAGASDAPAGPPDAPQPIDLTAATGRTLVGDRWPDGLRARIARIAAGEAPLPTADDLRASLRSALPGRASIELYASGDAAARQIGREPAAFDARVAFGRAELPADTALALGESLACGLSIGVVAATQTAAVGADEETVDPTAIAVAVATLEWLRDARPRDRLAAVLDALTGAFARACARESIDAELVPTPDGAARLAFAGQENAEAPLMLHHFRLELAKLGVHVGEDGVVVPHLSLEGDALGRATAALDAAVARMRTLLVEHNSWLCGGVRYVFPIAADQQLLADRGLARYRFPKLAHVDIDPEDDGVVIRFHPSTTLGDVTSSGFYVPTRIRGDFDATVDYEIRRFEPGPDSACLALFAQNEESTGRYYAQLTSSATSPTGRATRAQLDGVILGERPCDGQRGGFRLTRVGTTVTAYHRASRDDPWDALGTTDHGSPDDVIFGVKIWSKVACGWLEAVLRAFRLEAEIPADQFPVLEPRPDPRGEAD